MIVFDTIQNFLLIFSSVKRNILLLIETEFWEELTKAQEGPIIGFPIGYL